MRHPAIGSRLASSRFATPLALMIVGALAVGALAAGRMAIRSLNARGGRDEHLAVDGLEVRGPRSFDALEGHNHISLTTFRKSGEAVPTTVWFALVDGRLYVTTDPESGKMKRIRNNPRVVLSASNALGRARGESIEGVASPIESDPPERAERGLREKYGIWLAAFRLLSREPLIGRPTLQIRPASEVDS